MRNRGDILLSSVNQLELRLVQSYAWANVYRQADVFSRTLGSPSRFRRSKLSAALSSKIRGFAGELVVYAQDLKKNQCDDDQITTALRSLFELLSQAEPVNMDAPEASVPMETMTDARRALKRHIQEIRAAAGTTDETILVNKQLFAKALRELLQSHATLYLQELATLLQSPVKGLEGDDRALWEQLDPTMQQLAQELIGNLSDPLKKAVRKTLKGSIRESIMTTLSAKPSPEYGESGSGGSGAAVEGTGEPVPTAAAAAASGAEIAATAATPAPLAEAAPGATAEASADRPGLLARLRFARQATSKAGATAAPAEAARGAAADAPATLDWSINNDPDHDLEKQRRALGERVVQFSALVKAVVDKNPSEDLSTPFGEIGDLMIRYANELKQPSNRSLPNVEGENRALARLISTLKWMATTAWGYLTPTGRDDYSDTHRSLVAALASLQALSPSHEELSFSGVAAAATRALFAPSSKAEDGSAAAVSIGLKDPQEAVMGSHFIIGGDTEHPLNTDLIVVEQQFLKLVDPYFHSVNDARPSIEVCSNEDKNSKLYSFAHSAYEYGARLVGNEFPSDTPHIARARVRLIQRLMYLETAFWPQIEPLASEAIRARYTQLLQLHRALYQKVQEDHADIMASLPLFEDAPLPVDSAPPLIVSAPLPAAARASLLVVPVAAPPAALASQMSSPGNLEQEIPLPTSARNKPLVVAKSVSSGLFTVRNAQLMGGGIGMILGAATIITAVCLWALKHLSKHSQNTAGLAIIGGLVLFLLSVSWSVLTCTSSSRPALTKAASGEGATTSACSPGPAGRRLHPGIQW